jgi:hypothetical protein
MMSNTFSPKGVTKFHVRAAKSQEPGAEQAGGLAGGHLAGKWRRLSCMFRSVAELDS